MLFFLIFLLHDGTGIWQFLLRVVPTAVRTWTSRPAYLAAGREVGQVQCCGDATVVPDGGSNAGTIRATARFAEDEGVQLSPTFTSSSRAQSEARSGLTFSAAPASRIAHRASR